MTIRRCCSVRPQRCGRGYDPRAQWEDAGVSGTSGGEPESARVAARVRDEILDGVRVPGSKLVEREIAESLAVSRVPVRDALKALEAEGLVTLRPRTWAIVREFTASDIADLNEVRSAVESVTFRLVAERHTEEELARLRTTVDAELAAAAAGDPIEARRAAADFHEVATELSGNHLLREWMQVIRSRMRWLMAQHDDLLHIAREHEALYDAIARRDLDKVSELAANHLVNTQDLGSAGADGAPSPHHP